MKTARPWQIWGWRLAIICTPGVPLSPSLISASNTSKLFRNDGNLNFTDVSNISRIARATTHVVGWGDAFYDIDNDGWLDLIAVNGHVYPQVDQANIGINFREPGQLFLNQRDGTFRDVSDQVGPALKLPARGTRPGHRRPV